MVHCSPLEVAKNKPHLLRKDKNQPKKSKLGSIELQMESRKVSAVQLRQEGKGASWGKWG